MEMDKAEIEKVLRRLKDVERKIILLRCEGKPHEEVAGLTYVSETYSKSTISKLYQMLYLSELPDAEKQAYLIEKVKPIVLEIMSEETGKEDSSIDKLNEGDNDSLKWQSNQDSTQDELNEVKPTDYTGLDFNSGSEETEYNQSLHSNQDSIPINSDEVELSEDNGVAFDTASDKNDEQGDQMKDPTSAENIMSDNPEDFAGIEPNRRNNRLRRVITIVGSVIVFLVIMACVGTLFIQNNNLRNQVAALSTENLTSSNVLKETVIQEVIQVITQEVTREVTVVVPATSQSIESPATPEQVIVVVTATPLPPTPTQDGQLAEPGYVYFDDFEEMLDPGWLITKGDLGTIKGHFTVTTPYGQNDGLSHVAYIDGWLWRNFRITFDLADFQEWGESLRVLLRYTPGQGGTGLTIPSGGFAQVEFSTITSDDEWIPVPGTMEKTDVRYGKTFVIEVSGEIFRVYANGEQITYGTIQGPETGVVGLIFTSSDSTREDSYAPRIDYFEIEALP